MRALLTPVLALRAKLEKAGFPVPRIVCGGTPSFPIYAAIKDVPGWSVPPARMYCTTSATAASTPTLARSSPRRCCSPASSASRRRTASRSTSAPKAVASDPPAGKRVHLPGVRPAPRPVGHNEEHYIVRDGPTPDPLPTPATWSTRLPSHICPTVALHKEALIAEHGLIVGSWPIIGRDRVPDGLMDLSFRAGSVSDGLPTGSSHQ